MGRNSREENANRMDAAEEPMTPKKMLEKMVELDHNHSQLRDLNDEIKKWLDITDDEVVVLRTENASLRKQVKTLEKMVSDLKHTETEPFVSDQADDLYVKRCSEKIMKLEGESAMMNEQNKKLMAEIQWLQEERDQDKNSLNRFKVAIQTLVLGIEEAQLGLQQREEVIHQKNMLLKHSEETVEECSNFIKDLRLTNQELRKQLEERQDEASFSILNDVKREKDVSPSPPLSFAEEIKQLSSSVETQTTMSESTDPKHEEIGPEELLEHLTLTIEMRTLRCLGLLITAVQRAGLFLLFLFVLTLLAFVGSGSCAGNVFSINTLWNSLHLMFYPYCSVHYDALPPI